MKYEILITIYLDYVQNLENYNGQLLSELEDFKENYGNDANRWHRTYGIDLKSLRNAIDLGVRDQTIQEIQTRRFEYDIFQMQQHITVFNDHTRNRLIVIQQEFDVSCSLLEQIRYQFNRYSANIRQQRTIMENLSNQLNGLITELINCQLERIVAENNLQTLREHAAFLMAIYQVRREEFLSYGKHHVRMHSFISFPFLRYSHF